MSRVNDGVAQSQYPSLKAFHDDQSITGGDSWDEFYNTYRFGYDPTDLQLGDRMARFWNSPANSIYARAVFALDARRTPGVPAAGNTTMDLSSNAMRVRNGTTGSAMIVQDGRGGKALRCQNVNSSGAQASTAPTYTTGVIRIEVGFRTDTLTGESDSIFGQATGTSNISRMDLFINTTGGLQARIGTGSTDVEPTFDGFTWAANTEFFVACEWDPTTGDVRWYTSADRGASWTLAETDSAAVTPGTTVQSGGNVVAGNRNTATAGTRAFLGLVYFGRMYFDGTLVADFDPTRDASYSSLSWTSATTGETWTVTPGGSDNSDATYLPAPSTLGVDRYVYNPGASINGNGLSIPNGVATDDLEVIFRITSLRVGTEYPLGNLAGAGTFGLAHNTDGQFFVYGRDNSNTPSVWHTFTASGNPFTSGTTFWVRLTRTASTGAFTLQYSLSTSEPSVWTEFTTSTPGTVVTGTLNGTTAWNFGSGGNPYAGYLYSVKLRRTIGSGAWEVDFDAARDPVTATHSAFTASTGQTVTVNRATSGRKTVVVEAAKWALGADDYIEVADNALLDFGASDSFTVLAVVRGFDYAKDQAIVAKQTSPAAVNTGWSLQIRSVVTGYRGRLADGVALSSPDSASCTSGTLYSVGYVRSVPNDTVTVFLGGIAGTPATDTTTATIANSEVMRIGRFSGSGTSYLDGELYAVYIWREALTASELAAIAADWGAA